eukprot:NODE_689_length_1427_cov_48.783745_g512_i0.p1 GENE.NODE_689_length_1427_cov_48.783745_g512_i0~~NODE_689_length_1427_cov_48.783745_g512_i0.p1  ORF type:complete len:286 (-),score=91.58 NODE_689_length_1427_cov_48.783745_g512_i0:508-1365(-)
MALCCLRRPEVAGEGLAGAIAIASGTTHEVLAQKLQDLSSSLLYLHTNSKYLPGFTEPAEVAFPDPRDRLQAMARIAQAHAAATGHVLLEVESAYVYQVLEDLTGPLMTVHAGTVPDIELAYHVDLDADADADVETKAAAVLDVLTKAHLDATTGEVVPEEPEQNVDMGLAFDEVTGEPFEEKAAEDVEIVEEEEEDVGGEVNPENGLPLAENMFPEEDADAPAPLMFDNEMAEAEEDADEDEQLGGTNQLGSSNIMRKAVCLTNNWHPSWRHDHDGSKLLDGVP